MRLIRIHVATFPATGSTYSMDERGSAYVLKVLRLAVGDRVHLFDGNGREHEATIRAVRGRSAEMTIGAPVATIPESPLQIALIQGISRGERMDYAIQKATELGVQTIVPVICERSVVRLDAEQSGRAHVPAIAPPQSLTNCLASPPARTGLRLILDPTATTGLRDLEHRDSTVDLLIGPEGGLSDDERHMAMTANFRPVRLGPRILRTETAAAAAIAALQLLHGDLA